jgi:hypothetical protein
VLCPSSFAVVKACVFPAISSSIMTLLACCMCNLAVKVCLFFEMCVLVRHLDVLLFFIDHANVLLFCLCVYVEEFRKLQKKIKTWCSLVAPIKCMSRLYING